MADTKQKYTYSIGRRKNTTATLRLFEGEGISTINGRNIEDLYTLENDRAEIFAPLRVTGNLGKFWFTAKTSGGGVSGMIGAVKLALARALVKLDANIKPELKVHGLITRDPRMVERKKAGLRKARKAKQFSKR